MHISSFIEFKTLLEIVLDKRKEIKGIPEWFIPKNEDPTSYSIKKVPAVQEEGKEISELGYFIELKTPTETLLLNSNKDLRNRASIILQILYNNYPSITLCSGTLHDLTFEDAIRLSRIGTNKTLANIVEVIDSSVEGIVGNYESTSESVIYNSWVYSSEVKSDLFSFKMYDYSINTLDEIRTIVLKKLGNNLIDVVDYHAQILYRISNRVIEPAIVADGTTFKYKEDLNLFVSSKLKGVNKLVNSTAW